MRGMLGLVSLLIVGVGGAFYYSSMQAPVAQAGQYQKIESQANHAASLMQHDGEAQQAQVDAAMSDTPAAPAPAAPATNAPSAPPAPPAGN
jgi:hypothetical protein